MALRRWRVKAVLAAGALVCGSVPAHADEASRGPAPAGIESLDSAAIYQHVCRGCHMPNGEGAQGAGQYPALVGNPALVSWQYAALRILNGRGAMPAFGEKAVGLAALPGLPFYRPHLTDAQVADMVNYIRSHFGNHYKDKARASEVAKLPHPPKD